MTLGEAWRLGWVCTAHCYWFSRSKNGQAITACDTRYSLNMLTLVLTRGENFPLDKLSEYLRCPKCRERNVRVLFQPPTLPKQAVNE